MCVPLADEGVGLGPSSSSGPVASRPPLADRSASAASSTSGGGFARWPSSGSSCRLQWATMGGGGVKRRAIPSPGPLWRGLRIFCLAPPLAGVSPFLHHELSLAVVISFHSVLRALLRSFWVSSPSRAVRPPSWALAVFLRHLPSSSFASLPSTTLRSLVKMVLFFVALATAFPIDELQALSRCFSFVRGVACLSFVLTFVAICESLLVPSLAPSWLYRCPTLQLVSTYVLCFAQFVPSAFSWTGRLPCSMPLPSFCLSALPVSGSFCGRGFVPPPGGVHAAGAARLEVSPVRTHEFSGISSSVAFLSDGRLLCFFSLCFLCFFVLCMSQPKSPVGLCYMDTWSAEGLEFLRSSSSHFPGLCRLFLTCGHDSLFLRYPAIDIVWRGPVSLALGFLRPLAWWSPSPVGAVSSPSPGRQFCPS